MSGAGLRMKKILEIDKNQYLDEIKALHASRFSEPEGFRNFFFANCFKQVRVFGVLEDEKLICMAFAQSKKLIFNREIFNCQLLSYICTAENKTRQKNAFNLIEHVKEIFKSQNCAALYLCPVLPQVYNANGFVPFCFEREIVLRYRGGDAKSRKAGEKDAALIFNLYNDFMGDKNGFALRDEAFFDVFVQSQDIDLIYQDDKCCGYIAFDGYYFEVCARIRDLESVKAFDGRTISVPAAVSGRQDIIVSQMIAPLNSSLEPHFFIDKSNINFDRYW